MESSPPTDVTPEKADETTARPRTWKGRVVRLLLRLGLMYVLICAGLFLLQRRLQYQPSADVFRPSGEIYRALEEVEIVTEDGLRLAAWYWPSSLPATVVIFHGNGGNRVGRLSLMRRFHELGLGTFIVDYRGYGGSEGSPTEEGLFLDAEASLDWLEARGVAPLVFFGESLGCGVAVEMARRHAPQALLLQSPFTSTVDVAASLYWFLPMPLGLLMRDQYDNASRIGAVTTPVFMAHGDRDSLIPISLGEQLFEQAAGPKEWFPIAGGGHNDLLQVGGRGYMSAMAAFLRQHGVLK